MLYQFIAIYLLVKFYFTHRRKISLYCEALVANESGGYVKGENNELTRE